MAGHLTAALNLRLRACSPSYDEMMKKTILFIFLGINIARLWSQPNYDTTVVYADYTPIPVVVDGVDNDSCWNHAQWHNIDKVWIPYNATVSENDFKGTYKVAWDSNYLYLLVKIVDDSLADYYNDPLSNWWNDDCVEIFLDEDRSKGYHECSYNAFAYHVSIFYDAIDMSTSCAGINLRNNIVVKMDTIAPHTYLWEFAIKVYNKNFNPQNPELSRVKLQPGKHMGFAVAYCDYDGNPQHERENFIGSIFMPAAHNNDNYRTADYFGEMILTDSKNQWDGEAVRIDKLENPEDLFTYKPATHEIAFHKNFEKEFLLKIFTLDGKPVYQVKIEANRSSIQLPSFVSGLYLLLITDGVNISTSKIFQQ